MIIRYETAADVADISRLQYAAFKNHPVHPPGAEPTEHVIVERLRHSGGLALSLVAQRDGNVVGHVALSPASIGSADRGWFLLGPVGVLPSHQNQGIGSALIRQALAEMRGKGAEGVVLVGEPGFYGRFGFSSREEVTYPGVPLRYVLVLSFDGDIPSGDVTPHGAFR